MLEYKTRPCRVLERGSSEERKKHLENSAVMSSCLGSHNGDARRPLFDQHDSLELAYQLEDAKSELERLYHPSMFKCQPCQDMAHIQLYQQPA